MLTKALTPFLACILFISTSGLLIQAHFCQNQLQSISLYLTSESCHEADAPSCNSSAKTCCQQKESTKSDNCCHNTTDFVKLDLDQYFFKDYSKEKNFDFVGFSDYSKLQTTTSFFKNEIIFLHYKPPLIDRDAASLFQVFRC